MHIKYRFQDRVSFLLALFLFSGGVLVGQSIGTHSGSLQALFLRDIITLRSSQDPVEYALLSMTPAFSEQSTSSSASSATVMRPSPIVSTVSIASAPVSILSTPDGVASAPVPIKQPPRVEHASSSSVSSMSVHPSAPEDDIPAFDHTVFPVSKVPNWGAMYSAAEWNRSYEEMSSSSFVPVPAYDLSVLAGTRMYDLQRDLQQVNISKVTAKLFYSTRFFGSYGIDSGEFTGTHPGIDLKLAPGTPVGSIAGGRVYETGTDQYLGNYVMVEHVLPDTGLHVLSIYGHLQSISVKTGQDVAPGTTIGKVGSTGRSSGPHLHLQIDTKTEPGRHEPYAPDSVPSREEALSHTLHPITLIQQYASAH